MINPIKPSEVVEARTKTIPEGVIAAFNELIIERFNGTNSTVIQREVVERIMHKMLVSREYVFTHHLLDVEPIFEREGWNVEYDKPGYNETGEATFTFTPKKKR